MQRRRVCKLRSGDYLLVNYLDGNVIKDSEGKAPTLTAWSCSQ